MHEYPRIMEACHVLHTLSCRVVHNQQLALHYFAQHIVCSAYKSTEPERCQNVNEVGMHGRYVSGVYVTAGRLGYSLLAT